MSEKLNETHSNVNAQSNRAFDLESYDGKNPNETSSYGKKSLNDASEFAQKSSQIFEEEMDAKQYRLRERAKQGIIEKALGKKKIASENIIYRPNLNIPTEEQVEKAVEILEYGTMNGKIVDDAIKGKWNMYKSEKKRFEMARLELSDPITAEKIVSQDIQGWHGTSSRGLIGVLRHGLRSQYELSQQGIERVTGERLLTKEHKERKFVSFTADIKTAIRYASYGDYTDKNKSKYLVHDSDMAVAKSAKKFIKNEIKDGNDLARDNFPVLIGINGEYVEQKESKGEIYTIFSDMDNEFGLDKVDKQDIKILAVPDNKRQIVADALNQARLDEVIQIVSFDSIKYAVDKTWQIKKS